MSARVRRGAPAITGTRISGRPAGSAPVREDSGGEQRAKARAILARAEHTVSRYFEAVDGITRAGPRADFQSRATVKRVVHRLETRDKSTVDALREVRLRAMPLDQEAEGADAAWGPAVPDGMDEDATHVVGLAGRLQRRLDELHRLCRTLLGHRVDVDGLIRRLRAVVRRGQGPEERLGAGGPGGEPLEAGDTGAEVEGQLGAVEVGAAEGVSERRDAGSAGHPEHGDGDDSTAARDAMLQLPQPGGPRAELAALLNEVQAQLAGLEAKNRLLRAQSAHEVAHTMRELRTALRENARLRAGLLSDMASTYAAGVHGPDVGHEPPTVAPSADGPVPAPPPSPAWTVGPGPAPVGPPQPHPPIESTDADAVCSSVAKLLAAAMAATEAGGMAGVDDPTPSGAHASTASGNGDCDCSGGAPVVPGSTAQDLHAAAVGPCVVPDLRAGLDNAARRSVDPADGNGCHHKGSRDGCGTIDRCLRSGDEEAGPACSSAGIDPMPRSTAELAPRNKRTAAALDQLRALCVAASASAKAVGIADRFVAPGSARAGRSVAGLGLVAMAPPASVLADRVLDRIVEWHWSIASAVLVADEVERAAALHERASLRAQERAIVSEVLGTLRESLRFGSDAHVRDAAVRGASSAGSIAPLVSMVTHAEAFMEQLHPALLRAGARLQALAREHGAGWPVGRAASRTDAECEAAGGVAESESAGGADAEVDGDADAEVGVDADADSLGVADPGVFSSVARDVGTVVEELRECIGFLAPGSPGDPGSLSDAAVLEAFLPAGTTAGALAGASESLRAPLRRQFSLQRLLRLGADDGDAKVAADEEEGAPLLQFIRAEVTCDPALGGGCGGDMMLPPHTPSTAARWSLLRTASFASAPPLGRAGRIASEDELDVCPGSPGRQCGPLTVELRAEGTMACSVLNSTNGTQARGGDVTVEVSAVGAAAPCAPAPPLPETHSDAAPLPTARSRSPSASSGSETRITRASAFGDEVMDTADAGTAAGDTAAATAPPPTEPSPWAAARDPRPVLARRDLRPQLLRASTLLLGASHAPRDRIVTTLAAYAGFLEGLLQEAAGAIADANEQRTSAEAKLAEREGDEQLLAATLMRTHDGGRHLRSCLGALERVSRMGWDGFHVPVSEMVREASAVRSAAAPVLEGVLRRFDAMRDRWAREVQTMRVAGADPRNVCPCCFATAADADASRAARAEVEELRQARDRAVREVGRLRARLARVQDAVGASGGPQSAKSNGSVSTGMAASRGCDDLESQSVAPDTEWGPAELGAEANAVRAILRRAFSQLHGARGVAEAGPWDERRHDGTRGVGLGGGHAREATHFVPHPPVGRGGPGAAHNPHPPSLETLSRCVALLPFPPYLTCHSHPTSWRLYHSDSIASAPGTPPRRGERRALALGVMETQSAVESGARDGGNGDGPAELAGAMASAHATEPTGRKPECGEHGRVGRPAPLLGAIGRRHTVQVEGMLRGRGGVRHEIRRLPHLR